MVFNFNTSYLTLNPKFYSEVIPEKISNPEILILNKDLANKLRIEVSSKLPEILSGNTILETPLSQAYAGHQFGHFTNLGDGRAILLGEHIVNEERFDIQLKGAGITPYSRGGDGKATVGSMLREYVYSVALTNLGVESSQSLAVVLTNDLVYREKVEEGAILVRVMKSHIRVGTFEFVSYSSSKDELIKFADYVIERHYKDLLNKSNRYILFFEEVMNKQIEMVINWLRIGFIHGVMNTDNMSITGETFDYGPCSFMNSYDLNTRFSVIDTGGRYSFGNQEKILFWNLQRFAETLIPIIDENKEIAILKLEKVLSSFHSKFKKRFREMMKSKLGIRKEVECDNLIDKFLKWLKKSKADYTSCFIEIMNPNSFKNEEFKTQEFLDLREKIHKTGFDRETASKNNPYFILRNYIVEEAIEEYVRNKNLGKFNELLEIMKTPYKNNSKFKKYQKPPKKEFDLNYKTHCNT